VTAAFRASVVLDDLPDAMALARPPLVVVVVPGPSVSAVVVPGARRVTARRSDLADGGALLSRLGHDTGAPVLVGELQWADDHSLDAIVDRARRALDDPAGGDHLFAVWRAGARRPLLAELMALAAEGGSVVEVVPHTEATLIAAGHGADRAAALVAATGGLPDLVAAVTAGGDVADLIAPRLDVLDAATRRAAELLAFGASIGEHDATALAVEGLLPARPAERMPAAVAAVVRRHCAPERRAEVVDHVVATGDRLALARHLHDLGDRSRAAAACYLEAARVAPDETAVLLARAARESGADDVDARTLAAAALVRTGRPADAVRELDAVVDGSVESVRADAWAQLGDPVAAAAAFARAGETGWAEVMRIAAASPDEEMALDRAPVDDGSVPTLVAAAVGRWRSTGFGQTDDVLASLATAARRQASVGTDGDPLLAAELAVRVAERLGEHGVADRLASEAVEATDAGGRHRAHAELLAGWIEARRGVLDGRMRREPTTTCLAPRSRLVRDAARCASAVRDPEGSGLDVAVVDGAGAAAVVAPDLFDLDLRTDIAAAAERARADHLGDPIAATEPLIGRCGPSHRFDLAWCRLQAALAGDRLDRVADRARAVLALDPAHDRHRLAADVRALARIVTAPGAIAAPAEIVEVARAFATAGVPHVAARLCGIVATATTDETTARLLLRESRAWRSSRTRVRRASGGDDAVVRLSDQEERIGRMVLEGRTHKEIGAALFVSPKTVEHHVAHIRTKLGVTSRAEMMGALRDYLA
jgi:DNA-binding CsgD family transcriptional regulator